MIDIDENEDFETQNEEVNKKLSERLGQQEEEEMTPEQVEQEFNLIYESDPALQEILGGFPERYSVEEKQSIVEAYKKGGGVQGLAEIIDDEEEQEDGEGQFPPNPQRRSSRGVEEQEDELQINLDDSDDVKLIEEEFQRVYNSDEQFRTNFGEEAFELGPIQKYQIIDAYQKNGMDGVLALLSSSAD